MKNFFSLIIIAIVFSSCQEDVKFNSPSLQGLKDDVFWRANDVRAYVYPNGHLSIVGLTSHEELTLNTGNTNEGTYYLGTGSTNNKASYTLTSIDNSLVYETVIVPGPVAAIQTPFIAAGTGYTSGNSVETTGGFGSGLTVTTTANDLGEITDIIISTQGNGYKGGDVITVIGGDNNCKFRVLNVQGSNGEIKIIDYDNVNFTVTGEFKFNAVNVDNNPLGGAVLNYQYGAFYKVPVYPAP